MKTKILNSSIVTFIIVSALSVFWVSIMAFKDPQQVMDLVQVQLPNNDAYSSIRGVYGGVGVTIVAMLIILLRKNISLALVFLSFLWGMYAISRIITIYNEGELGSFGNQLLSIEALFAAIALVLLSIKYYSSRQLKSSNP